jgi:hypothetical protein
VERPIVIPWTPGPVPATGGPAVVSVTDFTLRGWTHYPDVARSGLRLRLGWFAMPGAVGLWLWTLPLALRTGSISVWSDTDALRRFVGLPLHVDVMRRNRDRGTIRSTTWAVEAFEPAEQRELARQWILSAG